MTIKEQRQPDCVFDIWSDNVIAAASAAKAETVLKLKEQLQRLNRGLHITHRIRVFLKPTVEPGSTPPAPDLPEGFIPWAGGECPVHGNTVVGAIMQFKPWEIIYPPMPANQLRWDWQNRPDDIVGYRVYKPADFEIKDGRYYILANGERVGPVRLEMHSRRLFGEPWSLRQWTKNGRAWPLLPSGGDPDIVALAADQTTPTKLAAGNDYRALRAPQLRSNSGGV